MTATLKEIRGKTERYFISKGVPNAKLDADLIIAHCLGIKRLDIYLSLERPIYEQELNAIRNCVRRRGQREPLQYILGYTELFNYRLKVDPRALIPRQETEYLIELCLPLVVNQARVLDLGTGSGAIALVIAMERPGISVLAVDKHETALSLAIENAAALEVGERVDFLISDWFDQVPKEKKYDLIVSNPPYLTDTELKTAEPEVSQFEPKQALISQEEGLFDLKKIIEKAPSFLAENGWLVVETGLNQKVALEDHARALGYQKVSTEKDLLNRDRFLLMQI